ncbi:peptide chain release factor N(5)-glutamine methyltransferase [Motilimonas eburnea]|uniref:peptide chain release factor N(5)-glutamine methyltransferase n=1 Tax=Motilimonas eburnea TaxID=1737488 RepID=UPI001E419D3C|nr:peptide chain release factor N(5)-glutamine methyltransferase [Motilimonas eburnea]MCE2569979.1 peptide chain release factor N(5)-glutamine methyltransferase [Motilimonas eburnea]
MKDKLLTIADALDWARQQLVQSESAALDARVLLAYSLEKPDSFLFTWPDKVLTDEQQVRFLALIARRVAGEPVAHITQVREFWSLPLKVSPATLIPRPDTEILVEQVLQLELPKLHEFGVLDLGTGTGAIALALASEWPNVSVIGIDIQGDAVELAQTNGQALGLSNASFKQGSWFEPVTGQQFSLIVSNPPYIDEQDRHLSEGDVRFEPRSALVAKDHGLADLALIARQAPTYLVERGYLVMEHGYDQGEAVRTLLVEQGFSDVQTLADYCQNDRITLGKWS